MKHQYFGDINDFFKYGLLHALSAEQRLKLGICWMLTADDSRRDGSRIGYLDEPNKWRPRNPALFDHLARYVKAEGKRSVRHMERDNILPGAMFYLRRLTDNAIERRRYFSDVLKRFAGVDLIFFDPDNGLEVKSVPLGKVNSSKYLYFSEVLAAFKAGHSILIYQHFRREDRKRFIANLAVILRTNTDAQEIYSFQTAHVVFLLLVQQRQSAHFRTGIRAVAQLWPAQFQCLSHLTYC